MLIIKNKVELKETIAQFKEQKYLINFVPTMGNLHQGHIGLINYAKKLNGKTVVSIFVNPMQFNNPSDLANYPRTIEDDIEKLKIAGADLLFIPDIATIYPSNPANISTTKVVVPVLSEVLEGSSRAGHFDGVTTVVSKLFNLVQADQAVFGEKDYQQLALINKMVIDLDMPVKIYSHPIVREEDGLAMSSRNTRLTKQQRAIAPCLYQALQKLKQQHHSYKTNYVKLQQELSQWLDSCGFITDYLIIADADTLLQADSKTKNKVILGAAVLGDIRLIDNIANNLK